MALNDDRVSQIVQSFALAALDPAQWLPAMASLSDSIGGVCCALELTDLNTGVAVMKNTLELDETLLRDYEERIFHINPRVKNGMLLQIYLRPKRYKPRRDRMSQIPIWSRTCKRLTD